MKASVKDIKLNKVTLCGTSSILSLLLLAVLSLSTQSNAQVKEHELTDSTAVRALKGTLLIPDTKGENIPLVLIIAGSGPTDRNGNGPQLKSDCLKMLAEELSKNGIASFRYDKRGVGASTVADKREEILVVEDFSNDAASWINRFKEDKRFSKVIVIGHSEGAFMGLLAAKEAKADGYISVAGTGRSIDVVLKEQFKSNPFNPEFILKENETILDSLKAGYRVKRVNQLLQSLYRPSIQPYIISWMKYDPAQLLSELPMPAMIVQGTTDIQVSMADAESLKQARPDAVYLIVSGMNHVLRDAPEERMANIAVYSQSEKPLSSELVPALLSFIFSIN